MTTKVEIYKKLTEDAELLVEAWVHVVELRFPGKVVDSLVEEVEDYVENEYQQREISEG
tara:strand:+ start:110 stop:286 length:177 start_codon:yes stop_codon:yes gene_type:complete